MSYGLIYTIPFRTVREDIPCVINIEEKDYTGNSTELKGGDTPITIDIDDEDFLYTPTKFSTAKIKVIGNDYLINLSTTSYQQHRVTLLRNGVVQWCGFVKPETYTQDYVSESFDLEIECSSSLSTLEYIDYSKKGDTLQFVSLWYLLQKCIISSNGNYSSVYIPYVYSDSKNNYSTFNDNILEGMYVSEQNFFDEDGKASNLKDVLENVCKLLSWTCIDYRGSLFFIDCDHAGLYYTYNNDLTSKIGIFTQNTLSVQNIGFNGSDHTLDMIGGYSKCTIKDSNYPVAEIIPSETWNSVVDINGSTVNSPNIKAMDSKDYWNIFLSQSPTVFKVYDYTNNCNNLGDEISVADRTIPRSSYLGSRLTRLCIYKTDDTDINMDDCIEIDVRRWRKKDNGKFTTDYISQDLIVLSYTKELPCTFFKDGCFYISGSAALSVDTQNFTTSADNGSKDDITLHFKLKIGDKYWNGSSWTSDDSKFSVLIKGAAEGFNSIANTKTLFMPYSGVSGYIIPINELLYGPIEFYMYTPEAFDGAAIFIKDFAIKYQKKDSETGVTSSNSDRTYENVVNSDYVNELDEIEMKISSYNFDGSCYSKVIMNNDYLKDNLYSAVQDKLIRPEEALITRIINRYSNTRLKLTQHINNPDELTPITKLTDNYFSSKKFIPWGGTIDVKENEFECKMIEL